MDRTERDRLVALYRDGYRAVVEALQRVLELRLVDQRRDLHLRRIEEHPVHACGFEHQFGKWQREERADFVAHPVMAEDVTGRREACVVRIGERHTPH